jgi:hypothetical protein
MCGYYPLSAYEVMNVLCFKIVILVSNKYKKALSYS